MSALGHCLAASVGDRNVLLGDGIGFIAGSGGDSIASLSEVVVFGVLFFEAG